MPFTLLNKHFRPIVGLALLLFFFVPGNGLAREATVANVNGNNNANTNVNANANNNQNQNINPAILQKRQEAIKKKEEQLQSIRSQITNYQNTTNVLEQKTQTVSEMLADLDKEINGAETALQNTEKDLAEAQKSISDKEHEIVLKELEIDKRRDFLEQYVRELSLLDKKTIVEVIMEKPSLSEYFQEMENIVNFEQRLQELLGQLHADKAGLTRERDDLEEKRGEQLALYGLQEEQKITLEHNRSYREELLKETEKEQDRLDTLISKGSAVASRLASEITALQSLGSKIDFGQALEEARVVSGLTGTRPAFLLGVLKVESNMGSNVGGGHYTSDMNPAQWDRFKGICSDLGYDPKDRPVSRKPCYRSLDGNCRGWGGAMGPAQFMPSTWMGYKDAVAKVTGHNPPDPWNLRDALTAMGLKLAKVEGVTAHNRQAEHKAASIYLAGGNWASFGWYGDRVLKFADAYEESIKQ